MTTQKELDECLEVALEVARRAGKFAYDALHGEKQVTIKMSAVDLVTETDKKVEELIFSTLREKFPSHRFIGEESTAESDQKQPLTDEPTWMVDPIDGTSNFVHGFPFSAVSIGLAVEKQPVMGVVFNFNLNQMFAAKKGGGATLNGSPLQVSRCTELNSVLLLNELGYRRDEEVLSKKIGTISKLGGDPNPVLGLRSIGSAALSMCMVAQGSADVYFEYGVHCWDIAAGDIIVREAGGVTMYPTGDPLDVMKRGVFCASTQELAEKILPNVHNLQQYFEAD